MKQEPPKPNRLALSSKGLPSAPFRAYDFRIGQTLANLWQINMTRMGKCHAWPESDHSS